MPPQPESLWRTRQECLTFHPGLTTHPHSSDRGKTSLQLPERYSHFLLRRKSWFLAILTITTLLAVAGLTQLRFDGEPREIFKQGDKEFALLEEYFEQFGPDDNGIALIVDGEIFSSAFARALRGFSSDVESLPDVLSIMSLLDVPGPNEEPLLPSPDSDPLLFEQARAFAQVHPFASGQLISTDGETILVTIELVEDGPQTMARVAPIYEGLLQLRQKWFGNLSCTANFTGSVPVRVETLASLPKEFFVTSSLGALLAMLVALGLFRSLSVTLVVAAGPGLAVLWTLGLMGWIGLKIDGISIPLPAIVFVVAFANAVHIMIEIRRTRDCSRSEAARRATSLLATACVLTALTTTIGFASLTLAETGSVQRFGLATAAGSILGLISNITIVPLLASMIRLPAGRAPRQPGDETTSRESLTLIARLVTSFSRPLSLLTLIVTATLIWTATQLKSDIVWTETLPLDSEINRASDLADEAFGGIMQVPVIVTWDQSLSFSHPRTLELIAKVQTLLEADPTFGPSLSILNFMPKSLRALPAGAREQIFMESMPAALSARMLKPDLRRTVINVRLPNTGAAATRPAVKTLQKDLQNLEQLYPDFSLHVTGSAVIAAENMSNVIRDLVRSLSFASITVFLVLTVALRSLTLGLLSVIPNAFPLLFNTGLLYYLDQPLQISSVLTFSICLGIAVDDTIHFLIRFIRERREGADVRVAIDRSFRTVGVALLITTAVISSAFLAATFSSMPGISFFGVLACSAMVAALLGDLVFLPALLNWVMGRKERQRQEKIQQRKGLRL